MKVFLTPRMWRAAREGRHILVSVTATYCGGDLYRHWIKLI